MGIITTPSVKSTRISLTLGNTDAPSRFRISAEIGDLPNFFALDDRDFSHLDAIGFTFLTSGPGLERCR